MLSSSVLTQGIDPAHFATFLTVMTFLKGVGVKAEQSEKERIQMIIRLVDGDEGAVELVDRVLDNAYQYMAAAYTVERTIQTQKFRLDPDRLNQITSDLVAKMNGQHDALIQSVVDANKVIERKLGTDMPEGGVYNGNPAHVAELNPNRAAIGSWAGRLVYSYFEERKR